MGTKNASFILGTPIVPYTLPINIGIYEALLLIINIREEEAHPIRRTHPDRMLWVFLVYPSTHKVVWTTLPVSDWGGDLPPHCVWSWGSVRQLT